MKARTIMHISCIEHFVIGPQLEDIIGLEIEDPGCRRAGVLFQMSP